ncbi:hypothetical protein [Massilia yuzhufengensis]|uniref:Lysozyme inhibitor LprI N-terminal domain-containing protein n=1 Tax=Massilia yuzhufengensis TaxID=1164594 RepID=A0A1I1G5A1_9BURK|nr:hypothetical protein [Massilia yuzhufengensis]SFC05008.1 hypothetical protein SAMN05216204_103155 [Massilia yuzhufengensis]
MRLFLALVFASLASTCLAADDPKQATAERLVALLQIDELYQDVAAACSGRIDLPGELRKTWEANRQHYAGLSPASAYWPEAEALYASYRAEVCAGNTAEAARKIYAKVFATRLSQAEMEGAVAAQDTPEGRALQAAVREAARLLSLYQVEEQERAIAAAGQRYRERVRELAARHKANPR